MHLQTLTSIPEFRAYRAALASAVRIAFVPTMGALHEGHASLIRHARALVGASGTVLASVFVNPTQFGPNEDFAKYPRTLDADLALLAQNTCDAVFAPAPGDMYPAGEPMVTVDPGPLGGVLEGAIRPTHFRGVCTVVLKLLAITQPHLLVMGQKDYQQNAVLRQMIRDLDLPVEHVMAPTVREPDGLAMSSRNRYLSADERTRATALHEGLVWARSKYQAGERDPAVLNRGMTEVLTRHGLVPQYALACHAETLAPCETSVAPPAVLLIAAKLGATRLIDNLLL